MIRYNEYTKFDQVVNVNDIFTIGDRKIIIKEIFNFNLNVYVSYDDNIGSGLIIEEIGSFVKTNKAFFDSVIHIQPENNECCNCKSKTI